MTEKSATPADVPEWVKSWLAATAQAIVSTGDHDCEACDAQIAPNGYGRYTMYLGDVGYDLKIPASAPKGGSLIVAATTGYDEYGTSWYSALDVRVIDGHRCMVLWGHALPEYSDENYVCEINVTLVPLEITDDGDQEDLIARIEKLADSVTNGYQIIGEVKYGLLQGPKQFRAAARIALTNNLRKQITTLLVANGMCPDNEEGSREVFEAIRILALHVEMDVAEKQRAGKTKAEGQKEEMGDA